MYIAGKKNKFLKRLILFSILIASYIFLSSSIYISNQKIKTSEYLVSSIMQILEIKESYYQNIIEREKELTTKQRDMALEERLKGKILLQVEANGATWYLNPVDLKRYYFGKPTDIFNIIKALSETMTEEEIIDYIYFNETFPAEYNGRFIRKQDTNEFYYIIPESGLSVPLNSPKEAFRLLKDMGLGIKNNEIRKIRVGEL